VLHPVFSWPVKTSQQHEDPLLCRQRGLPGPFDNGVMRFAYASTLLTNWMGDDGFLKRLSLRILEPNLYGDVTWFHGRISRSCETAEGTLIHIDVRGENQLGQTTTAGEAEALLPPLTPAVPNKRARTGIPEITSAEAPIGEDPVAAFERVCKQTPNRTAVLFRGVPHTYAELERQVDEISRSLDAYGLEPGMMVGLRLPRSPTLIASILAVLKARCAFLPLAPDQALTRTRNMLNDSEPHFVLADRETLKGLADENNAFELSKALFCVPFRPKAPLRTDLAAVIYTSGSSGLPKGVLVKRTSLARYIPEIREALDITERDVYLHSAAFTFSASLRQLFTPLSVGAVVCLADFEETHAPLSLLRLIARSGTTVWDTVPTIWSHILEELGAMNPDRRREALSNQLRMIAFTGEPFPWSLLDTWRSYRPARVEIVNLYSQTETGSVCAHHVPHDERHPSRGIVPLGQAFGSVQVYLLDDADQRVAPGGIGELCVEGCRLAGGYLNDTALTNRKFRQDSCNDTPGRRVFHTGDLAVENPHGQFEYLGRKDRQVKIRGIRVQPAEIEHALRQHPSVSAAIVLLREGDGPSKERFLMPEKRLIGFVVTRRLESTDALEPTSAELKRFLRTQLPGFMIPDDLWVVDALPINDSGKVDRDALRKRQASLVESEEAYVAPMTEIERALAAIWRDLLGLEAVSVTANFFDLGGHSLMAARMVSRVNDAFGRQTPLSEFFAEPTIRRLAQTIDDGERTADWHEADQ
jgi:amino acid adenylation domain-containing protein